jgi:hypothetical protein
MNSQPSNASPLNAAALDRPAGTVAAATAPAIAADSARANSIAIDDHDPQLEATLGQVETQLTLLADAMRSHNALLIDTHASELHRALSVAVEHFSQAARTRAVPPALRSRLAKAGGNVAAQRENLARAMASLDRAIDVLLAREPLTVYSAQGAADRMSRSGALQA